MVRPTDLPVVHPTYEHRPLCAAEVIELAHNRPVAGVNPDDPLVKAIGRLNPGVIMNGVFREARQQGYLLALSPDGYDRKGDISECRRKPRVSIGFGSIWAQQGRAGI
ncbi:MAG: hypothetical protein ACR2OU_08410 [Thermomicrobiales bacterium]